MEDVKQEGVLGAENTQADGNVTEEQTKGLQNFLAGLFKGKETGSKDEGSKGAATETENKASAQTQGLKKEDVDAAIEEAKTQWIRELEEKERKKGLSPEDAVKEENETAKKEMASLRQQLLERDLRAKASSELDKLGYPVGLAELLHYDDEASMKKSLAITQETFKVYLEMAVNQRLKGKTPEGLGGTGNPQNDLRDQIAKGIRGGN